MPTIRVWGAPAASKQQRVVGVGGQGPKQGGPTQLWCMAACCGTEALLLRVTPLVHQPTLHGCQAVSCLLAGHWQLGAPLLLAWLHYPA